MTAPASRLLANGPLFWSGTAMCVIGVGLHLPMFVSTAPMGFRMAGMPTPPMMLLGMALIVVGLVVAGWGLIPTRAAPRSGARFTVTQPPDAPLRPAHYRLVLALFFAMVIDQLKPATLAFIEPGMRAEYRISSTTVAALPVVALTGTVLGSLLWGVLADRIGRRPSILLATLMFLATTICGTMPAFGWNLVMCLLMGVSAGGMLPVTYALLAETVPVRHRGLIMVLLSGLTTVVSYLVASGMAALFVPLLSWRFLWFAQLPLVLGLLAVNRWIPESPGFLAMRDEPDRARRIAADFGATLVPAEQPPATGPSPAAGFAAVLTARYRRQTMVIAAYAMSWGLVYWGFMTFLPSLLRDASGAGAPGARLLSVSALLALPATALVAVCYRLAGSRWTMVGYGGLTAAALVVLGLTRASTGWPTTIALVLLLTGASGTLAVVGPYAAEVYPTAVRGVASGLAAGCGKAGGIFGPPLVGLLLAAFPGARVSAFLVAAPMAVATAIAGWRGVDTRTVAEAPRTAPTLVSEASP